MRTTPWLSRAPETTTGVLGKARPSSSPVRAEPTRTMRRPWPEQWGQDQSPDGRAHHRQLVRPAAVIARGPEQWGQWAARRHEAQATMGA